jgi:hypothetical protein
VIRDRHPVRSSGFALLAVLLLLLVANTFALLAWTTALGQLRVANASERGLRLEMAARRTLAGLDTRTWETSGLPGPSGRPVTIGHGAVEVTLTPLGPETFLVGATAVDSITGARRGRTEMRWLWAPDRVLPAWEAPWRVAGGMSGPRMRRLDGVGILPSESRPLAPLDLALGWRRPAGGAGPAPPGADSLADRFGIDWMEPPDGPRPAIRDSIPSLRAVPGNLLLADGDTLIGYLWVGGDLVLSPGAMIRGGGRVLGDLVLASGATLLADRSVALEALGSSPAAWKLVPLPVPSFPTAR